jgi:16S rRNA (guanine527-N7)-methyltransferase
LAELAERYQLPARAPDQLEGLLELVAEEPSAITSVRDPADGVDTHVADSLVALELPVVREARRVADLGSGGGFPGLVLAIALPDARIALVESVSRKCAFLRGAVAELGIGNADVVQARAEAWPEGLEAHDLVTARALASLPVLVEYAAPLLEVGGHLVAWKGKPEPSEDADGRAAAATLGMSAPESVEVTPLTRALSRRLYVSSKVMSTPAGYPRRPGMARKRPLRASS